MLIQDYHFALLPQDDARALAPGDHHHVLAHPLAECRDVRHLPVARGDHRRAARQLDPRLPHAVPLQQLLRDRRSVPREPDRPRERRRSRSAGNETAGPPVSDLHRLAAGGSGAAEAGRGVPRRGARAARPAATDIAWASASSGSTTPRASSTACRRSTLSHRAPGMDGQASRFVQVAAPTRSKLPSYRAARRRRRRRWRDDINDRHGGAGLSRRSCSSPSITSRTKSSSCSARRIFASSRSLHDGMNLVAKEFVAARDDEQGVLVLSAFAGASRELGEAVIVNPYHTHAMGEAILRALTMPAERAARAHAADAGTGPRAGTSIGGPGRCCSTPRCASASASRPPSAMIADASAERIRRDRQIADA